MRIVLFGLLIVSLHSKVLYARKLVVIDSFLTEKNCPEKPGVLIFEDKYIRVLEVNGVHGPWSSAMTKKTIKGKGYKTYNAYWGTLVLLPPGKAHVKASYYIPEPTKIFPDGCQSSEPE